MGSLEKRDQKGHSSASALPLVAGITTEGRGLGTLVTSSDTGLPRSTALWVQSQASPQGPCTHQIPQGWVHTSSLVL